MLSFSLQKVLETSFPNKFSRKGEQELPFDLLDLTFCSCVAECNRIT